MSALLRDLRAERLRAAMTQAGVDAMLVAGDCWRSDYLRYAIDVTPMEGLALALLRREGPTRVFVAGPAEAARYAAEQPQLQVSWSSDPIAQAEAALAALGGGRLGLAPSHLMPQRLARGPGAGRLAECTALMERLMRHKAPAEADAMEQAVALTDEGYAYFREIARVGRREYEVLADLEAWFRARGCPEHFIIMGAGGQELRSMHPPGERKLQAGDLVTSEVTPCFEGYYAQICRTMVLGEPTQAQLDAHAIYVEAMEAGIAAVRPGATQGQVAKALNDVFRRHGLGEYVTNAYTRVRGHGMGLYVDESHVLEDVQLVLEPDMTLVVHPNTYHPAVGYMVLGDMVRVTATGCQVLTRTPRELAVNPA
ncbi:aminopeptidase P family protein [Ramlibacter sp. AW1]|uniref:Aminopeptidase P family protein n=1 Tax=Ramlibacter aurantiacus TaxID=2801330 RepID=A0A936ZYA8_9BURK|nr:Xaa-Pro peptidase family protein [Ramlibacter aurantiacus]MBL0422699.1 aminopeptidase P family protein [Ramlibacter aurantiacus]